MSIKEVIIAEIVRRAEALIAVLPVETSPPLDTRTDQQRSLDRFFSKKRFCEHHDAAVELVGILTGHTPVGQQKVEVPPFTILYCTTNKRPWILLHDNKGFPGLDTHFFNQAGCERMATKQEAQAFLDEFKKVNPDEFYKWCITKLDATRWMVEL